MSKTNSTTLRSTAVGSKTNTYIHGSLQLPHQLARDQRLVEYTSSDLIPVLSFQSACTSKVADDTLGSQIGKKIQGSCGWHCLQVFVVAPRQLSAHPFFFPIIRFFHLLSINT
jgi:hypothetical protein